MGQTMIDVLTGELALAEVSQNNGEQSQTQARDDEKGKRGDFSVDPRENKQSYLKLLVFKAGLKERALVAKTRLGRKDACFQMSVFYLFHLKNLGFQTEESLFKFIL